MIGLPIVFYVRYKKKDIYESTYSDGQPKRRPVRRLCFRHAVEAANAGADIDARHGEPDTVNDPKTWCAECRGEE